mgnify:CR=1 FL=1
MIYFEELIDSTYVIESVAMYSFEHNNIFQFHLYILCYKTVQTYQYMNIVK